CPRRDIIARIYFAVAIAEVKVTAEKYLKCTRAVSGYLKFLALFRGKIVRIYFAVALAKAKDTTEKGQKFWWNK
ncbi:MAG: hypothetical protein NTY61_03595, partial [Candidatus Parcubacteria bacterium]|nr:hypothetical protein [Candidatus Parcubacteria bacterium]